MKQQPKIRKRDLFKVFLRSFLLQASWSFDRMQAIGFSYAMEPALRRLYPDEKEYRSRLDLHMEYFNTQPYLASFILGASVRMEEERASGSAGTVDVSALKRALMAPLGALGDSFFWGALKPLAATLAVAMFMTGLTGAPVVFLILYNSVHVWLRADVLLCGYRSRGDAVSLLSRYPFTMLAQLFKSVTLAFLGGMLGMIPIWRPEFKIVTSASDTVTAATALLITLALVVVLQKGVSPLKLMLGLAVVCAALAFAGAA
jgi:PTS system mannose-specific IID component